VSVGGSQAAQLALVYQVYVQTKSGAWVAAALFATVSIGGLLGPVSGWVADRFDRRQVMVVSEATAGAAYLVIVFVHAPGLLILVAIVATAAGAPFRAASAAAIPNLVDVDDLAWANGLLGTAFNLALVAGPFVGGALVAVSGASLVFGVNAVSFAISSAVIAKTSGDFGGRATSGRIADGDRHGSLAGFRLLGRNRLLAPLAASSAFAFGAFGAALVIDPALARHFHAGSVGYGLLTTVWGGGAVIGSLTAGRVVMVARAPLAVVWGMLAMALSLGSIVVLPSFALIVAAGAIGGVGNGFVFVPWMLIIQDRIADNVRGRVFAAIEACDQVAFLIGMGLAAIAVSSVGPQRAYGLAGVLLLIATATAALAVATANRPRALERFVPPR
jgi:MFS family permease